MTGWRVTEQNAMPGGVQVTFATDDGQTHELFVGSGDYNPSKVAQLINARVAAFDAVGSLTSDTKG